MLFRIYSSFSATQNEKGQLTTMHQKKRGQMHYTESFKEEQCHKLDPFHCKMISQSAENIENDGDNLKFLGRSSHWKIKSFTLTPYGLKPTK